jgi:hypothetical protein
MIGLLFTGGTISMRLDPATGAAVPALGAAEILAQVPQLGAVTDFETEDFSRLPGPHVTPEQMWRLARRAAAWLERPDIDGLVITHGTDTIEETAYLLDLVLTSEKPVVLVGAMRTVSDPSWDGPSNLLAATRVAASPGARGQGVLVVMDDHIITARHGIVGRLRRARIRPPGCGRWRRRDLPPPDLPPASVAGRPRGRGSADFAPRNPRGPVAGLHRHPCVAGRCPRRG